ncbi:MAG TPA: TonB-dependent receptor [Candidatus Binatia bacterium]|nr:TonB-dependent receptor [Candidatus Binatia bacterium]
MRKTVVAVIIGCGLFCASAFAQDAATEPPGEGAAAQDTSPAAAPPAADAPPPSAPPPDTIPVKTEPAPTPPADSTRLEDVIVTATKRQKSLREIAGSIGEFNGARLENEGKISLADFIEQKPGVTLTSLGPHLVKVNIRGIASDAYFGAPLPSPTGMFIGDTAFGDPFITNVQPDLSAFDLARVEVLKGPQGTLFGGAALAGAIRYVLEEPVLGEWQARAFTQYDAPSDGSAALSEGVALNAPLFGDRLAVRLGYVNRNYPGITDSSRNPRKEDVDDSKGEQLRGIVSWQPLDALGVKFTHLQQDSFTANAIGFADSADGPRENNKKVLPQPSIADFGMDSLEVGYDFDTMRLVALTSRTSKNWYIDVDISYVITGPPDDDFDPDNGTFQITDDRSKSLSQELRLQSTDKHGLQWLVGLYNVDYKVFFEITDDTVRNRDLNAALGTDPATYHESTLLYAVTDIKAYEKAGFLDLGYRFWDRLELTAGARLYRTQVKGGFFGTGALARQQNNGQNFDFSGNELTEKGVNPKVTATFDFTHDLSAYALASRGFRFGGIQTVPSSDSNGVPPDYKSDTIWNYELGMRTSWLDNKLHFDTTLFFIDYDKPQVVLRTNNASGLNLAYTDNVEHAISQGFETALAWLTPLDGVRFELSGGYTDSHITAPFRAPSPYTSSGSTVVPAGARMPGVARYQYLAAINYVAPPIGVFDIGGRVDYSYIGGGVGTLLQERPINDYGTLNGGISVSTAAWRLRPRLSFNVSNITDVTAPKLGYTVKPVPGGLVDVWYLNAPRTYSARLGLEF